MISVSDGTATTSLPAFTVTVAQTNRAPTISGSPATGATVGQAYTFRPTAADADGDRLTFSVQGNPSWLSINSNDGTLTGTPAAANVGAATGIVISVSDGTATTSLPAFTVTVAQTNRAPTISGSPTTGATVGQAYTFRPTAADADGDSLTFSVRGNPGWLSINSNDGTLAGIPAAANVGTASGIVISVSDGTATTSLPAFTVTVAQTNRAPTISGSPATSATVGQAYTFRPTGADADGDSLTFSVRGNPAWLSINGTDGTLSGTPAAANVGTASGIVISVSDGTATTSLPAFAITVAQTNRAPTISGTPVTNARAGQPYAFRPTAADADGDRLTFSVRGNPAWLSINSNDGTLSGTPAAANVGTASGIVISVSDGTVTTSLPAFSITVAAALTTSVRVSWRAPATNEDGTPVSGLTGFRVFYGNVSGQYGQSLLASSPGITSVVIEGLTSSTTWYFVVKALAAGGVESDYSTEVSKAL